MRIVISIFVMLLISANVLAVCTTGIPDYYYLGTGLDKNGLCTAISTGEAAAATLDLVDTQNASVLKQAAQYAKQIEEVQNLVMQTEMMIKDLEENPLQVVTPDINQIIANQERINALANDISNNSSRVGDNLIRNLEHPNTIGLGHDSKFALWSENRRRNVEESYAKVQQFIKDMTKENEDAVVETKNAAALTDKTQAAKTTARIASQQLSTSQKMLELLNQLLGATATEQASKISQEIEAQKVLYDEANTTHVPNIDSDRYMGPGQINASPF